jgi:YD repeat-containing protein
VVVTAAGGVASNGKTFTVVTLTGISISPTNPSVPLGNKQQFTATGNYSDGSHLDLTNSATWTSSATSVATINSSGLASTLSQGTTTITASSGGFNAQTTLTVSPPALASIAVTPAYPAITAGATQQLTATGTYTDGSHQNLTATATWSSSATSVATINSSALATAVAPGQTTIQATVGSVSGSTVLAVTGIVSAGNMVSARSGATATLLNNGLVLITGGVDATGTELATAELYNPATNTFSATGSMAAARQRHSAALLDNGMVLVAGGFDANFNDLATAELYNPSTGTFSATGSLTTARAQHSATRLSNGTVMIAGGWDFTSSPISSTEIYDRLTGKFNPGGTMLTPHAFHTATLLSSGKVLIAGGLSNVNNSIDAAEVSDANAVSFTQAGNMTSPRGRHAASILNNGKIFLTGGIFINSSPPSSSEVPLAELYDPVTQTFTATGAMIVARDSETATLLQNGTVLVAGGSIANGTVLNSTEIYDGTAGVFNAGVNLNAGRTGHTATLLTNGRVLIAGGQDGNGTSLGSAEQYQPGVAPPAGLISIAISPVAPTINVGASQSFTATGTFSDNSTQILAVPVWATSNTAVATVTNDGGNRGAVFAVATGSATISACINSICGSTVVTVSAALATPSITSLSVTSATVGTSLTVNGSNFGTQQPGSKVLFDGAIPATINSWATGAIGVVVPQGARTGTVIVEVPGKASNTVSFTVKPLITSISPSSATPGTVVTINGSGFGAGCGQSSCASITFSGSGVDTNWTSFSDTAITLQVPAGTTSGNVTVKTAAGLVSAGASFTVPAPVLTNLTPNAGPVGSVVIIAGSSFGSLTPAGVSFNGVSATVYSQVDTGIEVIVPVGATSGNVTVTADGQTSNTLAFTVTAQPAPVISGVSPAAAPLGSAVTITGTKFGTTQGNSTVSFNGALASPTAWSDTMIVAPVPPGATTGNIVVTVNGQPSNGATFAAQSLIQSLSPSSGLVATVVTISGSSFGTTQGSSTVTFNGTLATPKSWSDTSIVVPVPFGAGTGNVVVTVNGTPSSGALFTVLAPTITSLSPNVGPAGSAVTINGANFGLLQGPNTVAFNGVTASTTSWKDNIITAVVPATATTGNVTVTVNGQVSNGIAFSVGASPSISSLSPSVAPIGTSITITGANFGSSPGTVTFNGVAGSPTSWASGSITVPVPTGATSGNVVVTVNGFASNAAPFIVGLAPSITSLSPTSGNFGNAVTITGANFGATQGTSVVTLSGVTAAVNSWSAGSIVALVPAGATSGNFVVSVNGQPSNGSPFTVSNPGPSLSSLSPTTGNEGTSVTINGSNFGSAQNTSTVTFNGTVASPSAWSSGSITVPVPAGASSGNVVVTVNGQGSNGLLFTILRPPVISSVSPTIGAFNTDVLITGSNFGVTQGSNSVTFNGTPGTPKLWSPTSIVVPLPAAATSGNIVVNAAGQASNGVAFTVQPTMTSVSPLFGQVGTTVTITGSNFGPTQGSSTITFNGTPATPSAWSSLAITAPVPAGATTGPISITVNGQTVSSGNFIIAVQPNITGVSPTSGNAGTSVTISGANFGNGAGSGVTFNGVSGTPTSWSDGSIVVPVPAAASSGNIVVTVNGLASNGVAFTVPNPTPVITSISPASGPVGTTVTITGNNFGTTPGSITFNGTTATQTSWNNGSIVVPVPAGATTGNVVVTVGGQASNGQLFTVTASPPVITSLSPAAGAAGTSVTIAGARFGTTTGTVKFNGTTATTTAWADGSITATVPSGATTGNVVVTSANFLVSNGMCFAIPSATPCIGNVSPSAASVGTSVTISGNGFGSTQGSVTFTAPGLPPNFGASATITAWTNTSITATVPQNIGTPVNVFVTIGSVSSNPFSFSVLPPQITSITPNVAQIGNLLTIKGINFGPTQGQSSIQLASSVSSQNVVFAVPVSWSNTSIVAPVPFQATTGPVFVVVGTSLGSNGINISVGPNITSLSPAFGAVGTSVTISGVNFGATQANSTVTFNGVTATPTSWSNTSIVVPVPAGATTGNVVVKVNGLPSLGVSFIVGTPPAITSLSPTSGSVGTMVTVAGSNFGNTQGTGTISFNGTAATPTAWNSTSITTTVPAGATTGNVVVTANQMTSNGASFLVGPPPTITGLAPTSGTAGTVVTVSGSGFGTSQGTSKITFNGAVATPNTWNDGSISVPVPAAASTGPVVVSISGVNSNSVTFTVPTSPSITTISPGSGGPNSSVTITGSNFGVNQLDSVVHFNGLPAVVSSWSSGSITALVPTYATSGPVTVTVGGLTSNGVSFNVIGTGTLSGKVTSSPGGAAISGATVQLLQNQVVKASATTDSSGNYSVANVIIGTYDVKVTASGFGAGLNNAVAITPGVTTSLNVSLTTPGTIAGKVTQSDGITGIPGATVTVFVGSAVASAVTTDSTGSYSVGNLSANSYAVEASAGGFVANSQTATVTGGNNTTANFALLNNGTGVVKYTYDELGRITAVIDTNGDTATYTYDAVGNIVSIGRHNSSRVSIISFTPGGAGIGATVTINGTGFSATASQNTVSFNGATATASSATSTQLVVTVPAGATTGPITVTTPSGSAVSGSNFVVGAAPNAPTISSFTPTAGTPGSVVTVTGTNFSADVTKMYFGGAKASLNSVNATTIVAPVPAPAASGRINIVTAAGSTASTQDFLVPFGSHQPGDIAFSARMNIGTTQTVTLSGPHSIALLLFDASISQGINLQLSGSTFSNCTIYLFDTLGNQLASSACTSDVAAGPSITAPLSGTYTVGIDPGGSAGSINVSLVADATSAITVDGPPVTVNTTASSPDTNLNFTGTSGQRVLLQVSNVSNPGATVLLVQPNGTTQASVAISNSPAGQIFLLGRNILPFPGNYTLWVQHNGSNTGSETLQLSTVPADVSGSMTLGGAALPVSTVAGQFAGISFNNPQSQSVTLQWSGSTYSGCTLSITGPASATGNVSCSGASGSLSLGTVDPGNYFVLLQPQGAGGLNLTVTTP